MFDDDLDDHEGAGKGLTPKVSSPRQEYMSLAAVPRFSRPSMELQVSSAPATSGAAFFFGPWCASLKQWWCLSSQRELPDYSIYRIISSLISNQLDGVGS